VDLFKSDWRSILSVYSCPRSIFLKTDLTQDRSKFASVNGVQVMFTEWHYSVYRNKSGKRWTSCIYSSNRSKVEDHQNKLSRLSCSHGTILHENNIGVISKNGCVFALRDTLIPCHQL
jgi:hypothetical protein